MHTEFRELAGVLLPGSAGEVGDAGKVELSSIASGHALSPPRQTIGLKYVAAGTEVYHYADRSHRVGAGMFLVVPEGNAGEATIDIRDGNAVGMCVYLPAGKEVIRKSDRLEAPLMFPAKCSDLGRLLSETHSRMRRSRQEAPTMARQLLSTVQSHFEPFLVDTLRALDGLGAVKVSTRYETLRRLNKARAYLHGVVDRPVDLAELASHAGVSRFQLARGFTESFGVPPAAYHRRVRLELAREQLGMRRMTCSGAALRYGFGDVAHFSRAYRRAFGCPPSIDI